MHTTSTLFLLSLNSRRLGLASAGLTLTMNDCHAKMLAMKEKIVASMNLANRSLFVGLLAFSALCSHAEIAADEFPSAADEREEGAQRLLL